MLIANELIALLAGESRVLLGQWLIRALIFKVDWGNMQYEKMNTNIPSFNSTSKAVVLKNI